MTTIERSIEINASADEVLAVTVDAPERLPEWYEGVEWVEISDDYPDVGSQTRLHYKAAGFGFDVSTTILEHIRGVKLVQSMEGMINGTQTWTYLSEGGVTYITAIYEYEMPGGGLGAIADKLVVERMNTQNLEKSLENLKALVEGY